jgi:hypothetical protein
LNRTLEGIRELLLDRLAAVGVDDMRPSGDGEVCRGSCPVCNKADRFKIGPYKDDHGYWVKCYAHCPKQKVLTALELGWRDLLIDSEEQDVPALVRRKFSEIKFEPVRFLVPERVPRQGITALVGDPFAGKSTWAALAAARTSRGVYGEAKAVAYINAEDSAKTISGPRLKQAGAELERVETLTVNVEGAEQMITLPDNVDLLEAFVVETGAGLIVLDPLNAFLVEKTDSHNDHSVRRALAGLSMMAERQDVAVLVNMHLNKDQQQQVLYRVGGTIGFVGLARSVLLFAHDPDDPDGPDGDRRLLAHVGSNWAGIASTLRYVRKTACWQEGLETIEASYLVPDGESDYKAKDLVGRREKEPTKQGQAEDAICEALADGPRLSSAVKAEVMLKLSCKHATVERAATELRFSGVLTSSGHGSATYWRLATEQAPHSSPRDEEEEVQEAKRDPLDIGGSPSSAEPPPPQVRDKDEEVGEQVSLDLDKTASDNGASDRERAEAELRRLQGLGG